MPYGYQPSYQYGQMPNYYTQPQNYNGYNGYNYGVNMNNTTPNYNNQIQSSAPQVANQQDTLVGKYVDGLDVVKSTNADLSGTPNWFPKTDGTEVYCKRLNPQTGASYIQTYKLVDANEVNGNNVQKVLTEEQITTLLSGFKNEISGEIAEIKNLVLDSLTSPKGGIR